MKLKTIIFFLFFLSTILCFSQSSGQYNGINYNVLNVDCNYYRSKGIAPLLQNKTWQMTQMYADSIPVDESLSKSFQFVFSADSLQTESELVLAVLRTVRDTVVNLNFKYKINQTASTISLFNGETGDLQKIFKVTCLTPGHFALTFPENGKTPDEQIFVVPTDIPSGIFQFVRQFSTYKIGDAPITSVSEQISATFFGFTSPSTFGAVKAGEVNFGGKNVEASKSYFAFNLRATPLPASWLVTSANGFPALSKTINSLPDTFALTSSNPDSILATSGLVVTLDKAITGADSVQLQLFKSSGGTSVPVFKTKVSGLSSYRFSGSEISNLASGSYVEYTLSVKATKQTDTLVSGKKYRFLTIRAIDKSVYIK